MLGCRWTACACTPQMPPPGKGGQYHLGSLATCAHLPPSGSPCCSTRMTESAESIVRSLPFIDVVLQLGRIAQGTNDLEGAGNLSLPQYRRPARRAAYRRPFRVHVAQRLCAHSRFIRTLTAADYEGVSHLDALGIAAHKLLCVAAYLEFLCAVQLLLLLHPTVASQPDGFGWFAAHSAAAGGSVPILRLLLGVAPDTIRAQEHADGDTPFEKALTRQHSEAARYLLQDGPGDGAHSSLLWCWQHHRKPEFLLPLFVELAIHHPLSAAQWEQLPAPCPGLSGALPAALQRSHAQARLLVQHLPPTELAVLHTALLCLARQQRTCGVALPPPLIERVLCMAFA